MKYFLLLLILSYSFNNIKAQPYIDIASIQYLNSPDAGLINRNKNHDNICFYAIGCNLPILLNAQKTKLLLFNPSFEKWDISIHSAYDTNMHCVSASMPVIFITPLTHHWEVAVGPLFRMNTTNNYSQDNVLMKTFQVGGYCLFSKQLSEKIKYKLGIYYNREFFGNFIVPLVGIDWKINKKNNLFGVLPASLTFEHMVNKKLYYGCLFESYTKSFYNDIANKGWVRIDDNKLSAYADYYVAKSLALRLEIGHSLLRKIQTNTKDFIVNDNYYIRLQMSHRIRF